VCMCVRVCLRPRTADLRPERCTGVAMAVAVGMLEVAVYVYGVGVRMYHLCAYVYGVGVRMVLVCVCIMCVLMCMCVDVLLGACIVRMRKCELVLMSSCLSCIPPGPLQGSQWPRHHVRRWTSHHRTGMCASRAKGVLAPICLR